jgi:O-antigen/teichoic acid export membrane protein
MTGTTLAQAVPILISPILTRLYSPEYFGIFAQYVALVSLISILATGRYEMAIMIERDDEDALNIVCLIFLISIGVSILTLLCVLLFKNDISHLLGTQLIADWLIFVPLSALLMGMNQCLNYWCNRKSFYRRLAITRILQSSGAAAGQVGGGIGGAESSGLVLGNILGQFLAISSYMHCAIQSAKVYIQSVSISGIKELAIKYKKFPTYQVPSTFIESVSSQLPIIMLGSFYGVEVVGLFSISQRVIRTPIMIIGRSVGDVFRQRAGKNYSENQDVRPEFIRTLKGLIAVSLLPSIIFFLIAPDLFAFIFGYNWRVAGEYARILLPLFLLSFIVSPLSVMFMIAEKQEYDLIIQILLVTSSAAVLAAGYYVFDSPKISLALFTGVYCLKYCVELYLSYHFCKLNGMNLEQA